MAVSFFGLDRANEFQRLYRAEERRATMMVGNFSLGLSRDLNLRLAAIDEALYTLADDLRRHPGFTKPGDTDIEARLNRRLGGLPPDIRGLYVFDHSGRLIHNTESPALLGADRHDRDYFRGARDAEGLFIGSPIRSRTNDEVVLSLSRRIDDGGGRILGVISISLSLDRVEQFYGLFELEPSVAIGLWRTDGTLLARRPPAANLVGTAPPGRPIQLAIEQGSRQGLTKGVSPIDGSVRLTSFRVLEGYPFALTVAMSEDGYLAEWRERRRSTLRDLVLAAAGLIGVAIALAVMFRRRSKERLAAEQDLREALQNLDASNHAKTMFLANMSHELRTPLNAIIGFSEMIRDERWGPVGSPRYREYATHIYGSGEHLLAVINDILDTTKIETGKWTLCYESLDPAHQVHEVVLTLQPLAEESGLSVCEDYAADLPPLTADRRALRQVLLNLLTNAVKFTPRGGSLGVAVKTGDGVMTISVSDTGIGMAAADLERIGRPFVRVGDPLTSRAGGTGLGLALSKSLIEMHGGRMTIDSAVGGGTTVTIELPVEPAAAPKETADLLNPG